jgi:hypothetical protein
MRKRLFISILIALAILAGYNVLIHFAAKKTMRQHLLAKIDQLPDSIECVFLGNSLIEAGGDADAFKSGWLQTNTPPGTVNLGLGATTPVEHYLILKRALSKPNHLKYVVYGFFDDQLNVSVRGNWEDLLGNRAFSYYFPKDAAAFYTPNSRLGALKMELVAHVPMLAERSSLWDKVELFRRQMDEVGMPPKKTNRFGRVADFNALEAADVPSFTQRCGTIVKSDQGFSAPMQAILKLAQEHGVKVFLVEMPMSAKHRETFYSLPVWAETREHLQKLASEHQAIYVAASDWVKDSGDFEDTVHLNEQGARFFSAQLAAEMSRMVSGNSNNVATAQSNTSVIVAKALETFAQRH